MPPWERYQQREEPQQPQEGGEGPRATPWRRYAARRDARPPARPAQPPRPQRGDSRPLIEEASQGLATLNRGIPFAQDLVNLIGGGVEAAQGGDFGQGMRETQERQNREQQDFRTRRPNVAAFTEGTGMALPVIATAGAAAPQALAQTGARGFPLLASQMGRGALAGAGGGFAYGAGAGDAPDQGWQERLETGNQGLALGGALGAATPPVVNAASAILSPASRLVGDLARRIPTPAPNSVGMGGGNLMAGGGGALRPPPPRGGAQEPDRLARLADRARTTADDVAAFGERALQRPGGERLVDAFGDAGVRQLRPIVQSPGRTGQLAAEATEQRFNEAPSVITDALRRRLGVGESRLQAVQRLDEDYQRMSATLYNPLWERPLTPQQTAALQSGTERLLNVPIMRRAVQRADELFETDVGLGLAQGTPDENIARWLHYIKMGLDDTINAGRRDGSLANNAMRQANEARAQLLRAMDENIPGYGDARSAWAGTAAAEEALEEGASFLRMLPDEVGQRVSRMTPFELQHARIGLADEVRRAVRGQVVGNRNVANGIINDPDAQRAILHVFDTPERAADFLDNAVTRESGEEFLDIVNTQNRLMRQASQWGGGSQTQGNQAYEAEGVVAAVAEAGGDLLGGRWGQAVNRAGRQIGNAVTGGVVERSNNRFGETLLRRIDTEEARAFMADVVRILREREAARAAGNALVSPAGQAAGIGGAGSRD